MLLERELLPIHAELRFLDGEIVLWARRAQTMSLREITRRELSAVTVRGGRNWFMGLLNTNTKAKRGV